MPRLHLATRLSPLSPLGMLGRWSVRAQQDACRNARLAATEAARERLVRAEVELYLESRREPGRAAAHG